MTPADAAKDTPENGAAPQKPPEKEKGFLRRAWEGAVKKGLELRYGKNEKRLAEVLARLRKTSAGNKLLVLAEENGVEIRMLQRTLFGNFAGYVDRDDGAAVPHVGLVNDGNAPAMTMTLHHELRHIGQQHARGVLNDAAYGFEIAGPRSYMSMLVDEADAFTFEVLEALRLKKAGQPEYAAALFGRGGQVIDEVERFLRRNPYETFHDDEKFARRLFTHLMLDGLNNYAVTYLSLIQADFYNLQSVKDLRADIESQLPPPPFSTPGEMLGAQYGKGYAARVNMTGLETVFFHTRPDREQSVLKQIDRLVKTADRLTEQEFAQAKQDITRRLGDAIRHMPAPAGFEEYDADLQTPRYSDQTESLRQTVRIAAQGETPMLKDSFRKAAAQHTGRKKPSPSFAQNPRKTGTGPHHAR